MTISLQTINIIKWKNSINAYPFFKYQQKDVQHPKSLLDIPYYNHTLLFHFLYLFLNYRQV